MDNKAKIGLLFLLTIIFTVVITSQLSNPNYFSSIIGEPEKPDFLYFTGNVNTDVLSVLPPIVEISIDGFVKNNGTGSARNVMVSFSAKTSDNRGFLNDVELIGTLEPDEIAQVEFIFTLSSDMSLDKISSSEVTISSDEFTRTIKFVSID